MNNKINKSLLIVIVAALCLIISGCLGGGTTSQEIESNLPDCETLSDSSLDWTNCQGTMTYTSGGQYVGEYKNDLFHGQGTYTYPDGEQLEGIWGEDEFLYENKGK